MIIKFQGKIYVFGLILCFNICPAQDNTDTLSVDQNDCNNFILMDHKLTGRINEKDWNFTSGFATRTLLLLFNQQVDPCDPKSFGRRDYVRINIKPTFREGIYNLANPDHADYVIDVKNIKGGVACYGCLACGELNIQIDEIKNQLTGQVFAQWIDGDYINGNFSIPMCFE